MAMLDGKGQIQPIHKGLWACEFSAGTLLQKRFFQEGQIQMRKWLEEQLMAPHTVVWIFFSGISQFESLKLKKKKEQQRTV